DGGGVEERLTVIDEAVGRDAHPFEQPAAEGEILTAPLLERSQPPLGEFLEQGRLAGDQRPPFARVVLALEAALHPDDLAALSLPLVLEPVGVDQPRGVLLGLLADRFDQPALIHGNSSRPRGSHRRRGSLRLLRNETRSTNSSSVSRFSS